MRVVKFSPRPDAGAQIAGDRRASRIRPYSPLRDTTKRVEKDGSPARGTLRRDPRPRYASKTELA